MKAYPIFVFKNADRTYSAQFPDFAGCYTAADTLAELPKMAQQALELHCQGDSHLPNPSSHKKWLDNPDYAGGWWYSIDIDTDRLLKKEFHEEKTKEYCAYLLGRELTDGENALVDLALDAKVSGKTLSFLEAVDEYIELLKEDAFMHPMDDTGAEAREKISRKVKEKRFAEELIRTAKEMAKK